MLPLPVPEHIDVFMLLKQDDISLMPVGIGNHPFASTGFFLDQQAAEHARTMEILRGGDSARFHVFQLSIPNPAHRRHNA